MPEETDINDEAPALDMQGPPGETVFSHPHMLAIQSGDFETTLQAIANEGMSHLVELSDERALVLVGALLVEGAVNRFLEVALPGFAPLRKDVDFRFSHRIAVARALQLCPARLFDTADVIRQVRNDFAHRLEARTLGAFPGRVEALRHRYTQFSGQPRADQSSAGMFKDLVGFTVVGIDIYAAHVQPLQAFGRSPGFIPLLSQRVKSGKR